MPKPIGPLCNLDCAYCYYLPKASLLPETAGGPIPDDLLEDFIRRYIAAQEVDYVIFTWHGGEPTLLGLDFFHKVVRLQQKHAVGKRIENDLQTNGLLLDGAWCDFLRQNRFLVGLSIDGPKHLHDRFRKSRAGESSFDQVARAVDLLRRYNVFFNTLTAVHSGNARHGAEVYRFLTEELDSRWIQWLPCVERKDYRTTAPGQWDPATMPILGSPEARPGHPASVVTDWSVDPDEWGEFLCQTFDRWISNDLGKVTVNWFESLVGQWMGLPAQLCFLAEVCGRALAIEKDGSLYSCDRFVYPEHRLGNLRDEGFELGDAAYSPRQHAFGCAKRDALPDYCRQCEYRVGCNGECPKNRFLTTPDGEPGLNYLCSGMKRFLAHADPHLRQIATRLQRTMKR
jgi:uncharacterized protein